MVDRIKNFFNSKLNGQHASSLNGGNPRTRLAPEETPAAALSKLKTQNSKLCVIALAGLLSGCGSYPRLLGYPFDSGGRSLNSPASELTPQVTGRYIVFTSDRFGRQDVYLFDAVNRSLIDLPGLNSFDEITSDPDVSENGRYIVFTASRQGRVGIFFYDRETRSSRNLTANLPAEVRNPTISADGNKIAFESSANGQWDILVYDRFGQPLNVPTAPR